ncbi:Ig kappa chain V region K-25 [Channa argus]|uniref:Ig kappa chain V region K-25 n=1 Tax=Channa argus TaxID=215402 RepID=A0A6G1Q4X0_CHAAH|nr:Ig kappa chain V region K-25 [Channa argus]
MYMFYVLMIPLFRAYGALLYAKPGDNVTLPCFYASESKYLCWYKQVAGEQPQIISSFNQQSPNSNTFHNQFINNKRFSVYTGDRYYHLNIFNLQGSDSAMYYCGQISDTVTTFDKGTFLVLKGAGADVIQTASIIQPGGIITAEVGKNVTLECFCKNEVVTFLSWYQQGLGGKPNIISTRMKHSTEVKIYPGYEERFQVFAGNQDGINHLIIKDLRLSDSATYYCGILEFNAVEFGRGTFLNVKQSLSNFKTIVDQPALVSHRSGDSVNLSCTSTNVPPFLVTVLIVALAVSIIVLLALAIVLYKLKKTLCSVCKGFLMSLLCWPIKRSPLSQSRERTEVLYIHPDRLIMMTPLKSAVCLIYLFVWTTVSSECSPADEAILETSRGNSVTSHLLCFCFECTNKAAITLRTASYDLQTFCSSRCLSWQWSLWFVAGCKSVFLTDTQIENSMQENTNVDRMKNNLMEEY